MRTLHQKPINQYEAPTTSRVSIRDDGGGGHPNIAIQYNTSDVRKETEAATDVSVYVKAFVKAAHSYLNGTHWRENAMEATPCEFRPPQSEATGQQIMTVANRTISFDPRKNWDNQTVAKGEVLAGSMVFTAPTDTALMLSYRHTILDHTMMAGFTQGSLEHSLSKVLYDIECSAAGSIAKILSTAPSTESISKAKPTGKPVDIAEDLIDILTLNINQAVGNTLSDFVILLPATLVATLERAAQRAGQDSIEDLLGASVRPYSGTDYGLFLLPMMFTSLSYRERRNGDVWKIEATRNGGHQAWDIEIMAIVDIVANGKVNVKLTANGLQTDTVAFPMITNIRLIESVTGVSLKDSAKSLAVGASYTNVATVAPATATNQAVTWTTSDATVASVSAAGTAKGLKVGTTTITVKTADGGFSASYVLTVTAS